MLRRLLKPAVVAAFVTMTATPAPAQPQVQLQVPGLEIHVGHRAPPPLRRERMGRPPAPGHVWVAGAWDWQGNDWAWVPGRWDRPVERGVRWVRAHYVREGRGWRYEPGHWSNQRLVEGEDYRTWRSEGRHRRDDRRDGEREREHRN